MIKAWIFDLSRVLLFPVDAGYKGELNKLHRELSETPGYKFWDYFRLDESQMSFLTEFKTNHTLYIFTSGTIQNTSELKPKLAKIFKKIYSAEEIGLSKKDFRAYKFIADDLNISCDEILYLDDSEENIKAAQSAGINAMLYKSFFKLKEDLEKQT